MMDLQVRRYRYSSFSCGPSSQTWHQFCKLTSGIPLQLLLSAFRVDSEGSGIRYLTLTTDHFRKDNLVMD